MAKVNPIRFSANYQDDETGLCYYGYRYYDPSAGRWLNRDPKEEDGGQNLYSFLQNDGVSFIDLLGLAKLRFEVVVGVFSPFSVSGKWSQPSWAGGGDDWISGNSAYSVITLNNEPVIWDIIHYTPDYCNTVQMPWSWIGTKGDAGTIRVYAEDDCGGDFTVIGFYDGTLTGTGPSGRNSGYGYSLLHDAYGRELASAKITPKSPIAQPWTFIYERVTLQPKKEKLVAEYIPITALKNRDQSGGKSAHVKITGYLELDIYNK